MASEDSRVRLVGAFAGVGSGKNYLAVGWNAHLRMFYGL